MQEEGILGGGRGSGAERAWEVVQTPHSWAWQPHIGCLDLHQLNCWHRFE